MNNIHNHKTKFFLILKFYFNCLLHVGSGTWKNSEIPPRPWDLEKFRSLPLYIDKGGRGSLGFEKISSFLLLRIKHVGKAPREARCEVSLFCLLLIGSGTWKYSDLSLSIKALGLGKIPSFPLGSGTEK